MAKINIKNQQGFTLIELLVIIAVIGVLLSISFGSLAIVSRSEAQEAANHTASLLNTCKIATLSGEENPRFKIELRDNNYYGIVYVGDLDNPQIKEEQILGNRGLPLNFAPSSINMDNNNFGFDNNGTLILPDLDENIEISFGNTSNSTVKITVNTGYIRID